MASSSIWSAPASSSCSAPTGWRAALACAQARAASYSVAGRRCGSLGRNYCGASEVEAVPFSLDEKVATRSPGRMRAGAGVTRVNRLATGSSQAHPCGSACSSCCNNVSIRGSTQSGNGAKVMHKYLLATAIFLVPQMALAQDFQKCLDLGISRQVCEDALVATSPDSEAGKEALRAAIEDDVHKNDPSWKYYKNGQW